MSQPAVKDARVQTRPLASPDSVSGKPKADHTGDHEESRAWSWRDLSRVLFVAIAAIAIWFARGLPIPYISAIGAICALSGGYPIYHEAYENIVQRRMTMELSMAIAIVAALAIRETFTALVITLFVLAAEILEGLTVGRGRNAIQRLLDLLPNQATVRRGTEWRDCAIDEVRAGDAVLVRPGGRIPVDGVVVTGNSFVDQAAITGESLAVEEMLPGVVESTPGRLINPVHWKFVSRNWVATRHSEKSSKKSNAQRNLVRRFKRPPTGSRDTLSISPWAPLR